VICVSHFSETTTKRLSGSQECSADWEEPMPKAISIVRVSTTGQATEDRAGLESQRVAIARIAKDHELEIVRELQLAGVSGARVMDDPRFLDMLLAIESAEITGVVVAHLDRLMRPEDPGYYAIFGRFRDTATILYTSEGPKDFRRDRLLMMLQSEIAAYERERIRERTMRGKEVHRRAGRHVAGPEGLPFAVDYRTENGRPVWSYKWPEAATARAVYERALAGEHNFSRIGRELGITRTLVRRILSNPIYAGVRRITHRYAGHRAHLRAAEDVIEHQVLDPPLVPMAWWEAAQPLLGKRFQVRHDSPCLYRGIARCGVCELPMHSHRDTHTGRWGYRCRSAARSSCAVGWLNRESVERAADQAVVEHLARPDVLELALRAALEPANEAAPTPAEAEKRIELLTRERGRVIESFEAGLRTLAEAEARTRTIETEVRTLRRAVRNTPQRGSVERLAAELAAPFAEWQFLNTDQRRRIVMASVRTLDVLRAGRAKARIRAVELTFSTPPSLLPHTTLVEHDDAGR
jgi:site-specific DNA recombinase